MARCIEEEKQILKALSRDRILKSDEIIFWIHDHFAPPLVSYHNIAVLLEGLMQRGFVTQELLPITAHRIYLRTKKRYQNQRTEHD